MICCQSCLICSVPGSSCCLHHFQHPTYTRTMTRCSQTRAMPCMPMLRTCIVCLFVQSMHLVMLIQLCRGPAAIGAWIYSSGVTGSSRRTRPLNGGWSTAAREVLAFLPTSKQYACDSRWLQSLGDS